MVEHLTRNEKVVGSIPTISSNNLGISGDIPRLFHFFSDFQWAFRKDRFVMLPHFTGLIICMTHTLTHKRKALKRPQDRRR